MNRPEPVVVSPTYPLYDSIKYLEHRGHGDYVTLMSIVNDIKNCCGRDSILHVDPDDTVNETYYEGEDLRVMRALVKEFELTTCARFDENY